MARPILDEAHIHPAIRDKVAGNRQDIVREVQAAIAAHPVVVVGMRQNPMPKKARRALERAGIAHPEARLSHNVYVVDLDLAVLGIRRFRARNPGYRKGMPCVYVGMTGLPPGERFQNHKAGIKANGYVKKFGKGLLPELFAHLNPMPYEAAKRMEQDLADELQEKGYAVWQA